MASDDESDDDNDKKKEDDDEEEVRLLLVRVSWSKYRRSVPSIKSAPVELM